MIVPLEPELGEGKNSIEDRISSLNKTQRKKLSAILDELEEQPNT